MGNYEINCSAHTQERPRQGRSLIKAQQVICSRAANEHLAVVFDPRNDCTSNEYIITEPSLSPSVLHTL